jgi:hypothetical protein
MAQSAAVPGYDGIASLFPLLGDVTEPPLTVPPLTMPQQPVSHGELGETQAISTADVAAELATPVAPYVVPQSAPIPIVAAAAPAAFPAAFPMADPAAVPVVDPFLTARRSVHAAPTAHPTSRPRRSSRGRNIDRKASRRPSKATSMRGGASTDKPMRQRLFGVGVMVLVGGLFAVLAIPAYADNDGAALTAAAAVQTQKVAVANSAASTITTTARDGYTATSAADLKSLYAAAMREQNIAAYLRSGATAGCHRWATTTASASTSWRGA